MNAHEANRLAAATRIADLLWDAWESLPQPLRSSTRKSLADGVETSRQTSQAEWCRRAGMANPSKPHPEVWTTVVAILRERERTYDPFAMERAS